MDPECKSETTQPRLMGTFGPRCEHELDLLAGARNRVGIRWLLQVVLDAVLFLDAEDYGLTALRADEIHGRAEVPTNTLGVVPRIGLVVVVP